MTALSPAETLYVLLGIFTAGVAVGVWFGVRFGRWLERHDVGG